MSSNAGPNARLAPLHGVQFLLEADPASILAIDEFRGRDNQISIILLEGGKAALRVHDEYTKGGRKLVTEIPADSVPPFIGTAPLTALPASFPEGTAQAFVDLDVTGGALDATGWTPTGLADRAIVQLRKTSNDGNTVNYTDHVGVVYAFVDSYGSFMTLMWLEALNSFRLI